MKKLILLILLPFNLLSQNVVWSEDFESYANGTQNSTKWTTQAGNCDADGAPGISGNNYWGTRSTLGDKEFCCEDIEGLTCCGSGQGQSDNIWLSESIDISNISNISIFISMRAEGNMECGQCGQGRDLFKSEYQLDGGSWTTFFSVCGLNDGESRIGTDCLDVSSYTSLRIRVLMGNQADDEEYYFDDVFVYEEDCATPLPVELSSFSAESSNDYNRITWVTESEYNSSHFELFKSEDGENWNRITLISSSINSTEKQTYEHTDWEVKNVINYYKLQQFDMDGRSEIFGPIAVNNLKKLSIVNQTTILGQKIEPNYRGLVLVTYQNGEKELILR